MNFFQKIKQSLRALNQAKEIHAFIMNDEKSPKVNLGKIQALLHNQMDTITRLSQVEFQVFSQWGEDGIIQWLINKIDIPNKTFVEFGVENYRESNTRFLLISNNWEGLVMDGSAENIKYIKNDAVSYAHHLHAKTAFITKENINQLLSDLPFDSEIGLLSIDIDGNDYWVWKEINVVNPVLVVVEYNAHFKLNPWTIPYKEDFVRKVGEAAMNYWGVSLVSLCDLASEKGYFFVGCNSEGSNAFFVRKDKIGDIPVLQPEAGYEFAKFRETKDENGEWVSDKDRLRTLNNMQVYNTRKNETELINV